MNTGKFRLLSSFHVAISLSNSIVSAFFPDVTTDYEITVAPPARTNPVGRSVNA